MDGMVVGMVGREGKLGRGGKVSFGAVGIVIVGNVGRLGSGGKVPGLGRDGKLVGNVGCGRFGIDGNGGNVAPPGKFGIGGSGGSCWRRWRAARPTLMLENDSAIKNATTKQLKDAINARDMYDNKQIAFLGEEIVFECGKQGMDFGLYSRQGVAASQVGDILIMNG
ncbi:hypothetical protein COLO4_32367 [Corchorus olitorius]|uniref:Uncharacterized protein n=1 Tax=Corchorus olitorius TaxID=93759 RepID=A0A1R3GZU4_9ROSI|nr:hypothetical protein COLO4_32367 [Corchorus olitorius]